MCKNCDTFFILLDYSDSEYQNLFFFSRKSLSFMISIIKLLRMLLRIIPELTRISQNIHRTRSEGNLRSNLRNLKWLAETKANLFDSHRVCGKTLSCNASQGLEIPCCLFYTITSFYYERDLWINLFSSRVFLLFVFYKIFSDYSRFENVLEERSEKRGVWFQICVRSSNVFWSSSYLLRTLVVDDGIFARVRVAGIHSKRPSTAKLPLHIHILTLRRLLSEKSDVQTLNYILK